MNTQLSELESYALTLHHKVLLYWPKNHDRYRVELGKTGNANKKLANPTSAFGNFIAFDVLMSQLSLVGKSFLSQIIYMGLVF